jgi:hypothetical protein
MNKALAYSFLLLLLLLPLGASAAALTDGTSPPEVITQLVMNASKNPPGPVEKDVTDQTVQTIKAMAQDPRFKDMGGSLRESIAAEYNQFTLEGSLTPLYSDGSAALFYGKVKLTDDAFSDQKSNPDTDTLLVNGKAVSTSHDSGPGFGDSGGFSFFVGPPIKDAHVFATFCLVQQHGLWKVHGVYLSNDIIDGTNKAFIVSQLAAFAKKT